ncbi:hypothetical protein AB4Z48_04885 [Cupriavidus sp. 2TAF22]|uniref:hypothetical protein n=1 Tax=unclassified Cupriavidus TaxID=2640874 RepID=UPI003F921195
MRANLTYTQRSAKVVEEIKGGRMQGHVVESVKALPAEMTRTFFLARIHAIHDVGPGMCKKVVSDKTVRPKRTR